MTWPSLDGGESISETDVDVPNPWAIIPPGSKGWRSHTWEWGSDPRPHADAWGKGDDDA